MAAAWHLWLALPPLAAACRSDLRWRLIPDWSVLALIVLGLAGALAEGRLAGHAATGLGALLLGGVAGWRGVWGWGDAKLCGAAGLLVGPNGAAAALWWMALTGAALAAAMMAARPALAGTRPPAGWPRWARCELRRVRVAPSVPYALAIAGGVMGAAITAA